MLPKDTIRLEVQNRIKHLSESQKENESKVVSRKLIDILSTQAFENLVSYDPYSDEIDITAVNTWAKNLDKRVIIFEQKQTDIPEEKLDPKQTIAIVPGRAFTVDGIRLGRGIGWYDRFLAQHKNLKTIGTCFHCQVFETLPEEPHDIRMTQVVFPDNIVE